MNKQQKIIKKHLGEAREILRHALIINVQILSTNINLPNPSTRAEYDIRSIVSGVYQV